MRRTIAEELKKLDVQIGRKMFQISKVSNMEIPPSPLQGQILDYLIINRGKNVNGKDLEKFLGVSKVAISNALLSMETNGIIERKQSELDRRNKDIKLTDRSMDIFYQMFDLFNELEKEMISGIDKNDLRIFYNVLDKISNNLRSKKNDKGDN